MSQSKLLFVLAAAFLVAGCPSTTTIPDPDPDMSSSSSSSDDDSASTSGSGYDDLGDGESFSDGSDDPYADELAMIIRFDFDSSEVRAEDTETVARHALQLAENPDYRVQLEGHADERGSREYNIGLGERRAQAVRRLLLIQGASASQISTVSYGEERPLNSASTEDAWAENRRVEFVYK